MNVYEIMPSRGTALRKMVVGGGHGGIAVVRTLRGDRAIPADEEVSDVQQSRKIIRFPPA
jgi:hypothetical protein